MKKALLFLFKVSLCTVGYLYASSRITQAQVTSDGTVNTVVTPDGNVAEITGGETREGNLFHSFQDFSVGTGNEAFFNNANDISNIFSRVTGGNISNIDGLIRANGSASLFLINPAGILFGENARLDIGGSFFGSTADSILFNDGEFSATDLDNPPVLTVNAPIGLNFRDNPGDITVRGNGNGGRPFDSEIIDTQDALRVGSNATFSLVGNNLNFEDAVIKTAGGRIELGSVAGGQVNFVAVDNGLTLDYSAVENFSDISLVGRSNIDASGIGGGDIQVAGNNISITGVSGFTADTLGSEVGGEISILATESLDISGVENELNFVSAISNRIFPNGSADGGNITIEAGSLSIGDRALISTATLGQGNAGNIEINASESITLASQGNTSTISSNVTADAVGNGGDIDLATGSLSLSNGALINVSSAAQGNAGNIELNTGSLALNNEARLSASNSAFGNGGNIIINASDNISLTNSSILNVFAGGEGSITIDAKNLEVTTGSDIVVDIFTDAATEDAQSGDITINTTEDILVNGAGEELTQISNSTFGIGNAGNIEINSRNLSLINGAAISSLNDGEGSAGNVFINASGDVIFDGISTQIGGIVNFSSTESTGTLGSIELQAQNLTITNGAGILVQAAGETNSGDINIDVDNTIRIDGSGLLITPTTEGFISSSISTIVFNDNIENSGNININTSNLFLSRNGSIDASILGQGSAGDININADLITIGEPGNTAISPSSIRSSVLGASDVSVEEVNGGNISINTGSLFINDGGDVSVGIGTGFDSNSSVGTGGSISINATDTVSVDGTGFIGETEVISGILADIGSNSTGDAGDININTAKLSVTNGAFISADILGNSTGNGGSITIRASDLIQVSGSGGIEVDVLTEDSGSNGGDLNIETGKLTVEDGAAISAITLGDGDAGTVTISATESIELQGFTETGRGGLFASALQGSGNGGDVNVFTNELTISDGAAISVSNFPSLEDSTFPPGTGEPGNINIQANSVSLSNEGRIIAATQSPTGEGANIDLQVAENITLQDNSFISARAFNQANGGNLSIDSSFIIAFPSNGNGNDIIASAEQGQGGDITINSNLLGIEEGLAIDGNNSNDIDASSEFSLDGNVTITTPDTDLIQGTTELPTNVIATEQTTAQACQANREALASNSFIINGKGGIPAEPGLPLQSHNVYVNGTTDDVSTMPPAIETSVGKIQLARGIRETESGGIILTAYRTNNSGDRIPEIQGNCG